MCTSRLNIKVWVLGNKIPHTFLDRSTEQTTSDPGKHVRLLTPHIKKISKSLKGLVAIKPQEILGLSRPAGGRGWGSYRRGVQSYSGMALMFNVWRKLVGHNE